MINKVWNSRVGIAIAFLAINASAETNGIENITLAGSNATEDVVAESVPLEKAPTEKRDKFDFIIGGGLVSAPEYGDFIEDVYESPALGYTSLDDVSGWLDLYLGFEYRPVSRIGIIVGGDLWVNAGVDATGGVIDEAYANAIFIPSIYGQLYVTSWLYVNAGVNFPMPETGSKYIEIESDGIGFGANIGIEIAKILRIEGGYVHVPVTVKTTSKFTAATGFAGGEEDYDFGGVQLRLLLAF